LVVVKFVATPIPPRHQQKTTCFLLPSNPRSGKESVVCGVW
jgi:hypothetical protein